MSDIEEDIMEEEMDYEDDEFEVDSPTMASPTNTAAGATSTAACAPSSTDASEWKPTQPTSGALDNTAVSGNSNKTSTIAEPAWLVASTAENDAEDKPKVESDSSPTVPVGTSSSSPSPTKSEADSDLNLNSPSPSPEASKDRTASSSETRAAPTTESAPASATNSPRRETPTEGSPAADRSNTSASSRGSRKTNTRGSVRHQTASRGSSGIGSANRFPDSGRSSPTSSMKFSARGSNHSSDSSSYANDSRPGSSGRFSDDQRLNRDGSEANSPTSSTREPLHNDQPPTTDISKEESTFGLTAVAAATSNDDRPSSGGKRIRQDQEGAKPSKEKKGRRASLTGLKAEQTSSATPMVMSLHKSAPVVATQESVTAVSISETSSATGGHRESVYSKPPAIAPRSNASTAKRHLTGKEARLERERQLADQRRREELLHQNQLAERKAVIRKEKKRIHDMLETEMRKMLQHLRETGGTDGIDEETLLMELSPEPSPNRSHLHQGKEASKWAQTPEPSLTGTKKPAPRSSGYGALHIIDPAVSDFLLGGKVRTAIVPQHFKQKMAKAKKEHTKPASTGASKLRSGSLPPIHKKSGPASGYRY